MVTNVQSDVPVPDNQAVAPLRLEPPLPPFRNPDPLNEFQAY
jgi:hypothetical protein